MICLLVLYGTAMGRADMPAMIDAAAAQPLSSGFDRPLLAYYVFIGSPVRPL